MRAVLSYISDEELARRKAWGLDRHDEMWEGAEDGVRHGGPDAVIEIRSPHDETDEKLPFYAAIGTREVIVIDRDTKQPEIFCLAGSQYVAQQADREGWLHAGTMQIRFRGTGTTPARLGVEDGTDATGGTVI
ncbi:MAG TPA: Uma2 family endonuclease [Vicinamibacterales bacterium]|nr:Uma2 family endonuclease [Vicinamibacterales bacterium]